MQPETWLLYLLAIVLIGISPGPIAMLSMSHGIHFGKMRSMATGLGSVSAALVLMMASAAGLGAIISASEYGFTLLKWCGAAYLVFLGIKLLLTKTKVKPLRLAIKRQRHAKATLSAGVSGGDQ